MTASQYVILTGRPGIFHTEIAPGMRALERYDYVFNGRVKVQFAIASLAHETKITIVDDGEPPTFSHVPSKLLKKYPSVLEARRDIEQLVNPHLPGAQLLRLAEPV